MTYTMLNFELGYVQGMNDLCSPILETIQDEADSFWCYAGFMEKMVSSINQKQNFDRDQTGMRTQLRRLELLLKVIDPPLYRHFGMNSLKNRINGFDQHVLLFQMAFDYV